MNSLKNKITQVKGQIESNQTKYDELVDYASKMSDGYIESIKIIIDMTSILASFDTLLADLNKMGVEGRNFGELKDKTSEKLKELSGRFNKHMTDIEGILGEDYSDNYRNIQQTFQEAQQGGRIFGGQVTKDIRKAL